MASRLTLWSALLVVTHATRAELPSLNLFRVATNHPSFLDTHDSPEQYFATLMEHERIRLEVHGAPAAHLCCGRLRQADIIREEISRARGGGPPPLVTHVSEEHDLACWEVSITHHEALEIGGESILILAPIPSLALLHESFVRVDDSSISFHPLVESRGIVVLLDRVPRHDPTTKARVESATRRMVESWQSLDYGLSGTQDPTPLMPEGSKILQGYLQQRRSCTRHVYVAASEVSPGAVTIEMQRMGEDFAMQDHCSFGILAWLAARPEVHAIEPMQDIKTLAGPGTRPIFPHHVVQDETPTIQNYHATISLQSGDPTDPHPLFDAGITGRGQIAQVTDTGFDDGSCYLRNSSSSEYLTGDWSSSAQVQRSLAKSPVTDFSFRKIVQYLSRNLTNPEFERDYYAGHGTHCATTLAGNEDRGAYDQSIDVQVTYSEDDLFSDCGNYTSLCDTFFCSTCGDYAGYCDTSCDFTITQWANKPRFHNESGTAPDAKLMVTTALILTARL